MHILSFVLLLSVGLFLGMLALLELGWRLDRRRRARAPEDEVSGVTAANGAVFALLGLLIAFSFSGAAARFDRRKELITDETTALSSAWGLLDLLPPDTRRAARERFTVYLDARLAAYAAVPDMEAVWAELARAKVAAGELWDGLIAARSGVEQGWEKLVLPALNTVFDIGEERTQVALRHPPKVLFGLLFVLALGCALLAGIAMGGAGRRPLLHMLAFSAVITVTVYVILDLEYPRLGLIRLDHSDQVLIDLSDELRAELR